MPVRVLFAEELEGAFRLADSPREARMHLRLEGRGSLSSLLRGEPVLLEGDAFAEGLLSGARIAGEVRLERHPAELVYSLATSGSEPSLLLRGRKRCLLADPYAGLTTLPLELLGAAGVVGHAILRSDWRGRRRAGLAGMRLQWR